MSDNLDGYLDAINEGTIDPLTMSPTEFADRISAAIADGAEPEPAEEPEANAGDDLNKRHLTVDVTFQDHTTYTSVNDTMHVNRYEEVSNTCVKMTGLSYTTGRQMVITVEYPTL
jgi:hypothetical protein